MSISWRYLYYRFLSEESIFSGNEWPACILEVPYIMEMSVRRGYSMVFAVVSANHYLHCH